jgi:hypothetical protein
VRNTFGGELQLLTRHRHAFERDGLPGQAIQRPIDDPHATCADLIEDNIPIADDL